MKLFNKAAYTGAAGYPGTTAMTQRTLLWEALQTAGLTDQNRTTVIATSTLTVAQCGLLMGNVSGASIVSTLPVAATAVDDAVYLLKRLDTSANSWTIAAGAANTIEGQASVTVPPGGILGIQLPGGSTDWKIIGAAGSPAVLPTGGTLTAYTLTPPIPITAYVRGLTFPVSFTVASGLNPTLAISAVAAPPNLVALQSDGTFANITAGQIPAGHISNALILSAAQALVVSMPPVAASSPAVRQTVLSGPVDTNGQSAFGGATGATTVTAAGTLVVTAANGILNRTGSIVNPAFTGLSTNGTMYLFSDIDAANVVTNGTGALAPLYQWGGTPSVVNGQFTFNIQEMKGYIGNGTTAPAGYRVYVGEVTVAVGVVSVIVWYALMGRYRSTALAFPAVSTPVLFSANIGSTDVDAAVWLVNLTAEVGYTNGELAIPLSQQAAGVGVPPLSIKDRNTIRVSGGVGAIFTTVNASTGANTTLTAANWNYYTVAKRRW